MSKKSKKKKPKRYRHSYIPKVKRLVKSGQLHPGVHVVDVTHDDRCPRLRGGICDCDPEVSVRPDVDDEMVN